MAILHATSPDECEARSQTPYQPLVLVAIALAAGIVLSRDGIAQGTYWLGLITAATCWCGWLMLWRRQCDGLAAVAMLVVVGATGATWHELRWEMFAANEIGRYAAADGAPACFEAVALERPARLPAPVATPLRAIPRGERTRLAVRLVRIRDGTRWLPVSGTSQLTVDGHLLGVRAGDRLTVFGQLRRIQPPANPGQFDAAANARAERRLTTVSCGWPECVRVSRKAEHWSLAATLDAIRSWAERIVRRAVGPERAPLATAMLLGNRNTLPGEVTDRFRTTGMIHLLVVSGLHVGIVVGGLFAAKWGGLLPRRVALLAIIVAVVFYTLLTGANPPVVRAAVLAVLVCLAMWTGRTVVSLNSLAAAAIVVLALNPADLFRTGPQLSFLAVATLIWIGSSLARRARLAAADPLTRLVEQSRPWPIRAGKRFLRWNVALLVATTAVWLVALPLVMNQMHVVSPVAVIVSPLVWPLVTIALVSGVAVVVVGLVLPPLAGGFGTICDWSLLGLEQLVNSAEQMPGGHFWVAGPANWWVIGFYLGVVALFVTGGRWLAVRWQVALLSLWIIAGLLPPLTASFRNEHRLECGFIAVGHGVCVCLHTPDGKTLLYDAGSLSSPEFAAGAIAGYLWDRGVQRIDGIVLSHADVDHFNAVPDLCARFAVSAVYVSPLMFDGFGATASEQSAPLTLRALLEERDIAVHEIWGGDRLRLGNDVVIEVLHPPQQGVFGSDNADSLTLGIEFAGRRVLLPGDLESPGLEAVMAELPYDCDVLLAPHHGSARSDPPGFAAWCQPELVVISGGGGPAVAGVANTYQSAGAQVLRTDRDGAVQVAIDADRVSAAGWLHADQQ